MELIEKNPYRIIGLIAGFSEREFQKQKTKITRYTSIGKSVDSEFDFPFLPSIIRDELILKKAFSQIEQSRERVNYSLFWFLNNNSFDDTAINYLINGNKEKAFNIWDKVISGKDINSKNCSCLNNLSTLQILSKSKDEIKEGILNKINLIESSSFKDFAIAVSDETYVIDSQGQVQNFINELLNELGQNYSNSELLEFFEKCDSETTKYVSKKLTDEIVLKLEFNIEKTKKIRKDYKKRAYDLGLQLLSESRSDLNKLKAIVGTQNINYKLISDNLSKEIMQCAIDFFNDIGQPEEQIDKVLDLLNKTKLICSNQSTIDRINENIKELNQIKYKDAYFIISVLKTIKEAIIKLGFDNILKRPYEKLTINKEKVDELLRSEITYTRIEKLVDSKNTDLINEFIDLIKYLQKELHSNGTQRIIDVLIQKLPSNNEFVVAELDRKRKVLEDERKRKLAEEEKKRKEKEENQRFWFIFLGVIALILIIAGAIWGWDGVLGVIIIGVMIIIGGSSR
jgi:hypothetical protein